MHKNVQRLTLDEKQKHEMEKEIYVTIRLIDMVEKCAQLSDDKISPEKHQEEITKLLSKLETFTKKVDRFDLNKFIIDYNLEDCKFGIDRIKNGPPQRKGGNKIQLVKELMQLFFQIQDVILTNQDNPKVATLKPLFDKLHYLLERAEKELPQYETHRAELRNVMENAFGKKAIIDCLNEQEFSDLQIVLDSAQQSFMNSHQ